MITDFVKGLTEDVGFDCETKPIAGIEQAVLMLNWLDIDKNKTQWNETKTRITKLTLKAEKRGFMFKGMKKFFGGFSKVKGSGFEHGVNLKFFHMDDENIHQINQAVKSGLYVAIVEVKAKGINQQDAFEVVGYDYGLQTTEGQRNYNEADGTYNLSFGTPGHLKEPRAVYKWLENDYTNTLQRFNVKLEERVVEDDFRIFDTTFNEIFN